MKGNITKDLKALPEIVNILFPLENLGDDIQTACVDLFELVVRTRKAYVRLRSGSVDFAGEKGEGRGRVRGAGR